MKRPTKRPTHRRIRATVLQPVLTWTAARNARVRGLAAAMQLRCSPARHFAVILPDVKPTGAIAFSIKVDPTRFPADLWPAFQQAARDRGEVPIDALRRLLESYIKTPPDQVPR